MKIKDLVPILEAAAVPDKVPDKVPDMEDYMRRGISNFLVFKSLPYVRLRKNYLKAT